MARDMTSPTLDALVKELRDKALRDCVGQQVIAEKTAEWNAATELTRLSKENATLQARVGELEESLKDTARRLNEWVSIAAGQRQRAEKAEKAEA